MIIYPLQIQIFIYIYIADVMIHIYSVQIECTNSIIFAAAADVEARQTWKESDNQMTCIVLCSM